MSEEQPPGGPERPEAQPPRNGSRLRYRRDRACRRTIHGQPVAAGNGRLGLKGQEST
jgi:hypothetical protein